MPGNRPPLTVGLTGGIASGKSTVCRLFAQRDVPIIDADLIAHEIVAPGQPALDAITETFGVSVLLPDGRLNRPLLRSIVFEDPARRKELESILHPRIRREMSARAIEMTSAYCLMAIPLLVENHLQDTVDRVLVVDVPEEVQRRRLKVRDRSSDEEIDDILASQATREERLAAADDIIDNSGNVEDLPPQVERLHQRYLHLAGRRASSPRQ